jgi:hypothetical protein
MHAIIFQITEDELRRRLNKCYLMGAGIFICILALGFVGGQELSDILLTSLTVAPLFAGALIWGNRRSKKLFRNQPVIVDEHQISYPSVGMDSEVTFDDLIRVTFFKTPEDVVRIQLKTVKGRVINLIGYENMDFLAQLIQNRVDDLILEEKMTGN